MPQWTSPLPCNDPDTLADRGQGPEPILLSETLRDVLGKTASQARDLMRVEPVDGRVAVVGYGDRIRELATEWGLVLPGRDTST